MDYYSLSRITVFIIGISSYFVQSLEPRDIAFLVLSQGNKYNYKFGTDLKQNIIDQAEQYKQDIPLVDLSHEDFSHVGHWIVLPLIPKLLTRYQNTSSWLVVCTENTRIKLDKLINVLSKHDHTKEIWLGHALYDREATIIHHFAFHEDPHSFLYPNMASGFAISMPLLKRLSRRVKKLKNTDVEFSIDASHELAMFIWNKGRGTILKHQGEFCIKEDDSYCASFVAPFVPCGESVPNKSIYFAVKTYSNFHRDRVPIVKNTWAKYTTNIGFFSDVTDKDIPTINLGVPNTEHGHCGKTTAILKYVSDEIRHKPEIKWVIIADDDTILSVSRLQQLLSCYDSSEHIALGERYGYQVHTTQGYNYITGGGGMVYSAPLVHTLTAPGACDCPVDNAPDDMYLGVCLVRMDVKVIHSPYFHQARPNDYAPEFLASQAVVSFHKHWMIDPVIVYETWFADVDQQNSISDVSKMKIEL